MSTNVTVAVGPNSQDDFRKLLVDALGRLKTVVEGAVEGSVSFQGLSTEGRVTLVSLNAATWTPLPATALNNRNSIAIQNQTGNGTAVLINYSPTAPAEGIRIEDGGFRSMAIREAIPIYGRMASGTGVVAVEELA